MQSTTNTNLIAVFIAVISAMLGAQTTMSRKAEHKILVTSLSINNYWSWYQAKSTRQSLVLDKVAHDRYEGEKQQIAAQARLEEAKRQVAYRQSAGYDIAGGLLSAALAVAGLCMIVMSNPQSSRAAIGLFSISMLFSAGAVGLLIHGFIIGMPAGSLSIDLGLTEYLASLW